MRRCTWECLGRNFFWLWVGWLNCWLNHRCNGHILLIQPIHCSHCSSPTINGTCCIAHERQSSQSIITMTEVQAICKKPLWSHLCDFVSNSDTVAFGPSAQVLLFLQCWEDLQRQWIVPVQSLPAFSSKSVLLLPVVLKDSDNIYTCIAVNLTSKQEYLQHTHPNNRTITYMDAALHLRVPG